MSKKRQNKKAFFAASSNGATKSRATYEQTICCLEDQGYEVLPSWIVKLVRRSQKSLSHNPRQVLEEQQALLREANLMVVECTTPSFGIGFLIHLAFQERIPVLCLYPNDIDTTELSDMILGSDSSLMNLRPYDRNNIEIAIKDFDREYSPDDLHKFNFIASREVLDYIEQGALVSSKSKSEFLRDELTKVIRSKK